MIRYSTIAAIALVAHVAFKAAPSADAQEPAEMAERALKAAGITTDTPSLLRLLAQRTLQDVDRPLFEKLIRQLDSEVFEDRQLAQDELLRRGPLALPFLKAALNANPSLELRRRAENTIREIDASAGRDTIVAAARLLAARSADGAIEALLSYVPNADEAWLEEEVLTSLGRLAIKHGEPNAKLMAALQDPLPQRSSAVLYLLGRRGNVAHRALVRSFLTNADARLRDRAVQGLLGKRFMQEQLDGGPADDTALKNSGIAPTETALVEYLHKRTPDTEEQARLAGMVLQLGSLEYVDRYFAAEALRSAGTGALPFLRPAVANRDAEVSRRARRAIEEIQHGAGPASTIAVARRLARPGMVKDVPGAIRTLVDFVPFAEDESVEDEVVNALTLLSVRQPRIDPVLPAALDDALPARRAAAAYVLGCTGTEEYLLPVRRRLSDPALSVRLRAAQGLLAARDKAAVPALIALLSERQLAGAWRIEESLHRLAGDRPIEATGSSANASSANAITAWHKWWHDHQDTIDLARAADVDALLGLVTVCEYDSGMAGRFTGQVWEAARKGEPSFRVANLVGPMDAQVLPGGRMLVAENGANRVTERDRDGNVKWESTIQGGNPICCQRLPNGNTFIALYTQLLEVRPDQSEVYRFMPGPQFYVFAARKTRTGTIACVTAQGTIVEVDPVQQKTLRTINLGPPVGGGGWAGIEPLANGNFLVATLNNNMLREVDPQGSTVWSITSPIPGVFRATRLPNGNHLVVSMSTREVAELDRNGAVRWRHTCQGRPWSVHYR
jgi:HEAT repeat protein